MTQVGGKFKEGMKRNFLTLKQSSFYMEGDNIYYRLRRIGAPATMKDVADVFV